ncbi:polysaccharide lyase 8 family protein [Paenibacillus sp. JSM ZJ436]|uniref:polysaccharide lyase 8 family protein n=1 Tax=Paenibacillus sp. JSM ZJ436 TaxID=3376190 RepID=UPI0037A52FE7
MFDMLLERWRFLLVGGAAAESGRSPARGNDGDKQSQAVTRFVQSMTPDHGETLWSDLPKLINAADLHHNYSRLYEMTLALETAGSSLYQDSALEQSILQGLEWMYEHRYNEQVPTYGNWWYWEIGSPLLLVNILCLMKERLTPERMVQYLRPVHRFVPNPLMMRTADLPEPYLSTGANRVWKSRAFLFYSLLHEDAEGIAAARDALSPVFGTVSAGDGFYPDGSFIQHKKFPYTGGYGKSLLKELAELTFVLQGSQWTISKEQADEMAGWVQHSFAPFIFRGLMMEMVRGRELSRQTPGSHANVQAVAVASLQLAKAASPEPAAWLRSQAKQWLLALSEGWGDTGLGPAAASLAREVLQDESIEPAEEKVFCKVFASMDRAVSRAPGHALGVSMFSERIGSYESINGENLKGWYTAHGMTYLYNSDLRVYADGFWPTVNPHRLPGTTVSTVPRQDGFGLNRPLLGQFAGGVQCGQDSGLVGMELVEPDEFRARKSWFLFGEVYACLGTVLEGAAGATETIVDNRMLNQEGSNVLLIDGQEGVKESGDTLASSPAWMHLSGSVPGADIGYVFPDAGLLQVLREARSGSWRELDNKGSAELVTRHYLTAWFEHDATAQDEGYAYMLLPGASPQETARYAAEPGIHILACTREVHAVAEPGQGRFAAFFWEDGVKSAGPITCDQRASVMVKESEERIEVCVADPTHAEEGTIELELAILAGREVIACSELIAVTQLQPTVKLTFQRKGARGATQCVVFSKIEAS